MPSLLYFDSLDSQARQPFHVGSGTAIFRYRNATLRFRQSDNRLHFAYFGPTMTPLEALEYIKEEARRTKFSLEDTTEGVVFYIHDINMMPGPVQLTREKILQIPEVPDILHDDVSTTHTNVVKKRKVSKSSSQEEPPSKK